MNGLGLAILSTPKGVMSDTEARKNNVGGEVICRVFLRSQLGILKRKNNVQI